LDELATDELVTELVTEVFLVLKVQSDNSLAIPAGDPFFDSWKEVTEEFPRTIKITFFWLD